MNRREYLAAAAGIGFTGLAGCSQPGAPSDNETTTHKTTEELVWEGEVEWVKDSVELIDETAAGTYELATQDRRAIIGGETQSQAFTLYSGDEAWTSDPIRTEDGGVVSLDHLTLHEYPDLGIVLEEFETERYEGETDIAFRAIDVESGDVLWMNEFTRTRAGQVVATDSSVVFVGYGDDTESYQQIYKVDVGDGSVSHIGPDLSVSDGTDGYPLWGVYRLATDMVGVQLEEQSKVIDVASGSVLTEFTESDSYFLATEKNTGLFMRSIGGTELKLYDRDGTEEWGTTYSEDDDGLATGVFVTDDSVFVSFRRGTDTGMGFRSYDRVSAKTRWEVPAGDEVLLRNHLQDGKFIGNVSVDGVSGVWELDIGADSESFARPVFEAALDDVVYLDSQSALGVVPAQYEEGSLDVLKLDI